MAGWENPNSATSLLEWAEYHAKDLRGPFCYVCRRKKKGRGVEVEVVMMTRVSGLVELEGFRLYSNETRQVQTMMHQVDLIVLLGSKLLGPL